MTENRAFLLSAISLGNCSATPNLLPRSVGASFRTTSLSLNELNFATIGRVVPHLGPRQWTRSNFMDVGHAIFRSSLMESVTFCSQSSFRSQPLQGKIDCPPWTYSPGLKGPFQVHVLEAHLHHLRFQFRDPIFCASFAPCSSSIICVWCAKC